LVRVLPDHMTFHPLHRDGIEADVQQESVGVDDLDRLTRTRPQ